MTFRGELLVAGVGPTSVVKTMSMLDRVFRDAVEYGEVAFNPFKAVQKPSPGPRARRIRSRRCRSNASRSTSTCAATRQVRSSCGIWAYTGLRPQEALALHWYAVRKQTLLVELTNADGGLERLKNRKRSRKRSRTVDLMTPVQADLAA